MEHKAIEKLLRGIGSLLRLDSLPNFLSTEYNSVEKYLYFKYMYNENLGACFVLRVGDENGQVVLYANVCTRYTIVSNASWTRIAVGEGSPYSLENLRDVLFTYLLSKQVTGAKEWIRCFKIDSQLNSL